MTNNDCYIFGYELDGKGGGKALSADFSKKTLHEETPIWQHIDYSESNAREWLLSQGLEEMVIEALVSSETRPRTLALTNGVLLIIRGVNLNPGQSPEDMVSLRFWIEPGRVITVRQRRLLSVQDIADELKIGRGPAEIQQLIVAILERVTDRIAVFVDDLERRVEEHETEIATANVQALRGAVSEIRRQTAVVRRYLSPQRDALDGFCRIAKPMMTEPYILAVREQLERLIRYVEDLDLVRERALVIQEELNNRISHEQNARMYVFSIIAAVFLPITFITGIFGMNVAGLPGTEEPFAFWKVVMSMLGVSVAIVVYLKLKRWL